MYYGLVTAAPSEWKRDLKKDAQNNPPNNDKVETSILTDLPAGKLTCKTFQNVLIEKDFQEALASHRLCGLGITDSDKIREIYEFPFKITKETKLSIFQFKIIHNILLHGYWLHQMKILDSPLCCACGENETLMQMLVNCPTISAFWSEVFRRWNVNTKSKYEVDDLAIMYGFNVGDHTCVIFTYVILIAKWHIYFRKLDKISPCFASFQALLKEKVALEKRIAFRNGRLKQFNTKWKPVLFL